jgi:hypothetical protein
MKSGNSTSFAVRAKNRTTLTQRMATILAGDFE